MSEKNEIRIRACIYGGIILRSYLFKDINKVDLNYWQNIIAMMIESIVAMIYFLPIWLLFETTVEYIKEMN